MAGNAPEPNQTDTWRSADRVTSGLVVHESRSGGAYVRGTVGTPHGYVLVYSQGLQYVGPTPLEPASDPLKVTSLSLIIGGREKERVIDAAYSARKLATLARDFAREAAREAERAREKEQARAL
jgi:hypothetical protein